MLIFQLCNSNINEILIVKLKYFFIITGFVLKGTIDTTVHTLMRQIIAMEVASDNNTYNDAFLGKSNVEYSDWIQQPTSWGGAIEVKICYFLIVYIHNHLL